MSTEEQQAIERAKQDPEQNFKKTRRMGFPKLLSAQQIAQNNARQTQIDKLNERKEAVK